ncbi:hypothetical protein CRV15_29660 (plasmid) [Streptomyces clavuligerus]|nr:hypothetical protein CRV15_29660 [Streptomyces clavuligerus]QPJ98174.1 hypothetical protein GE265_34745 [Streptomyces clavuligerus]
MISVGFPRGIRWILPVWREARRRVRPTGWRAVNVPHLVTLVRAGARFERGNLAEHPEVRAA